MSRWDEDSGFPVADWQQEVTNRDTNLGYPEWAANEREQAAAVLEHAPIPVKLLERIDELTIPEVIQELCAWGSEDIYSEATECQPTVDYVLALIDRLASKPWSKKPELELQRALVLSTHHITEATNDLLNVGLRCEAITYDVVKYGFLIWCGDSKLLDTNAREFYYPELLALVKFARRKGFSWIKLDRDGDEAETLETFDW